MREWHPCGDPDNCCLSQRECIEAAGLAKPADEQDDRDGSPVEWSEKTAEKWDFDSDPDWR
jgi:hypothetical protein